MRRLGWLAVAVLVVVVAVSAIAGHVQAQGSENPIAPIPFIPRLCYVPGHDLNGDGRVNELDMNRWKDLLFRSGGTCQIGAPKADCPPGMDINGDGIITFDDLMTMLNRWRDCVQPPANVRP